MSIVRTLPTERVMQVVDFARFMQSQVLSHDVFIDEEETEEEIRADNERWDATFAASGDNGFCELKGNILLSYLLTQQTLFL